MQKQPNSQTAKQPKQPKQPKQMPSSVSFKLSSGNVVKPVTSLNKFAALLDCDSDYDSDSDSDSVSKTSILDEFEWGLGFKDIRGLKWGDIC